MVYRTLGRTGLKVGEIGMGCEGFVAQEGALTEPLIDAMEQDALAPLSILRVDGGASVNRFLMQFQSDILQKPIDRPRVVETTALGAAFLAGLAVGVWKDKSDVERLRESEEVFRPRMDKAEADGLCRDWERAVERSLGWETV